MTCLPFRQDLKATFLPSWFNKAPSPSGSDDSGVGLSPSPTNSDRRFHLESSPGRHYVVKGFGEEFAEEASTPAYNYDEAKSYFSQLGSPVTKNNNQVVQFVDQPKPFLSDIERKYISQPIKTTSHILPKKSCSKLGNKKKTSTSENLVSSKLDRCLQPKTGNGKPRQTSTKKKMSQKLNRAKSHSGVRVRTVRQLLDQSRKHPSMQAKHSLKVDQHRYFPYAGPHIPLPRDSKMVKHCFPSTTGLHSDGMSGPAALMEASGGVLHQMSHASSAHTSCETHISSTRSSFGNVMSPPNVTLPTSMQQSQIAPDPNCMMESSLSSQNSCFVTQQSNMYLSNQPPVSSTYLSQSQLDPNCTLKAIPCPSYENLISCDQTFVENYRVYSQSNFSQPAYQATSSMQIHSNDQAYPQIHQIAAIGDAEMLQDHLMMKPDSSRSKDSSGLLPIFHAIKNNQVDAVKVLLSDSPHTYAGPDGMTMLHEAALLPNPAVLELLLSSLSEWNILELINRKTVTFEGLTPLHLATEAGHVANMNLLLKHGADVTVQTDRTYTTSLHIAVKNANQAAVRTLVEFSKTGLRKFDIDLALAKQEKKASIKEEPLPIITCQKDRNGNAPLHFVADLQTTHGCDGLVVQVQEDFIRYLLENGADPSAINAEYKTPSQLLPTIGSFPRSCELHSLLGNVSPNATVGSLGSCLGFIESNFSALDFDRSPIHQNCSGQRQYGSEDSFLK